ncbi:HD-GYP domain-containing protein [Lucifera butyrica]|nr:HD domain-containing phosphohydrolase [Lucifera butyrica]
MQKITLEEIRPGVSLTRPLIADDGTVLLHEGIEMKERYIEYLRRNGITSLFIGDPEVKGTADREGNIYDQEQRQEAVKAAREQVNQFRVGKGIHLEGVKDIVADIINRVGRDPEKMLYLLDIRRKKEYMFSHAVNTCILSVMTGMGMGYDASQLNELGLAAMLHDIGKIKFSRQLALQFPEYLSKESREEYRRHSFYSLEILRENPALSDNVINACFQHHERWNGSGYPMGIKGEAISEYAQIIGIADVYDRLITGLPHRLPTPVYFAVAILNRAAGDYFNPAIIDHFNQNVAIYPMGKTVRLNNQQNGVILGVGIKNKTTPIVRITSDKDGKPVNQVVELDLLKNPELFIVDFEDPYFSYTKAYADRVYNDNTKRGADA